MPASRNRTHQCAPLTLALTTRCCHRLQASGGRPLRIEVTVTTQELSSSSHSISSAAASLDDSRSSLREALEGAAQWLLRRAAPTLLLPTAAAGASASHATTFSVAAGTDAAAGSVGDGGSVSTTTTSFLDMARIAMLGGDADTSDAGGLDAGWALVRGAAAEEGGSVGLRRLLQLLQQQPQPRQQQRARKLLGPAAPGQPLQPQQQQQGEEQEEDLGQFASWDWQQALLAAQDGGGPSRAAAGAAAPGGGDNAEAAAEEEVVIRITVELPPALPHNPNHSRMWWQSGGAVAAADWLRSLAPQRGGAAVPVGSGPAACAAAAERGPDRLELMVRVHRKSSRKAPIVLLLSATVKNPIGSLPEAPMR